MDKRLETNRRAWDEMTDRHVRGGGYRVEEFKAGAVGAEPNIPDDIGDVHGKSILHLQCHFGMDSLMWVRRGARVTGVDFSPRAVAEARMLAAETGLSAKFVEADVLALPDALSGQFDIVLTYYGTICWLPDIRRWGRVVAHFLKSGGFMYIADTHPAACLYEPGEDGGPLRLARPYFTGGQAERCETSGGTYAAPDAPRSERVTYEWQHTLGDVVGALVGAGLRIDYLHEFPYTFYDQFYYAKPASPMERDAAGWWRLKNAPDGLPLMFSLKASKST
jgi:SAM-dependent methyltransferase